MLSDDDYQVRCMAVNKILAIRGVQEVGRVVIPADVFEGGDQCDDDEEAHGYNARIASRCEQCSSIS